MEEDRVNAMELLVVRDTAAVARAFVARKRAQRRPPEPEQSFDALIAETPVVTRGSS